MNEENRWHLTAGVDAGASAAKAAIVRSRAGEEANVVSTATQRARRRNVADVARATFDEACSRARMDTGRLDYVASTGDGDAVEFRTGHFYSMTAHARGALFLIPEARAVLDIGGLHARAIRTDERGRVLAQRMTSQCASGSGQILENIARYLGVPLDDVGDLSCRARSPEEPSSICAVLAETDVINMVSRGISTPDILKGIHLSIAGRLVRLLGAIRAEGVVAFTGGLARDAGLVAALEESLQSLKSKGRSAAISIEVRTHPESIQAGALGAALLGAYRYRQLERKGRAPSRSDALATGR